MFYYCLSETLNRRVESDDIIASHSLLHEFLLSWFTFDAVVKLLRVAVWVRVGSFMWKIIIILCTETLSIHELLIEAFIFAGWALWGHRLLCCVNVLGLKALVFRFLFLFDKDLLKLYRIFQSFWARISLWWLLPLKSLAGCLDVFECWSCSRCNFFFFPLILLGQFCRMIRFLLVLHVYYSVFGVSLL